ncbi:hypothetical protein [Paracoccus sp. (in: a-proteobacteria)]|uniref:hypothetical protein n=1 Tax=Paracoccus sp. TaxID=267 RepID=UPI0026DF4B4C|nr:hypothetical protein [Paracoccus sp. (in: a-proteobacteria)]MDO5647935.1 hypothetical protein [Paracoccus sp. (in: a-proteobacteria)]
MSHNNEPERAAPRHMPAIIAIAVALLVAVLAFVVFRPGADEQNDGIATTPPPAGVTSTEAPVSIETPEAAVTTEPTPPAAGQAAPPPTN